MSDRLPDPRFRRQRLTAKERREVMEWPSHLHDHWQATVAWGQRLGQSLEEAQASAYGFIQALYLGPETLAPQARGFSSRAAPGRSWRPLCPHCGAHEHAGACGQAARRAS